MTTKNAIMNILKSYKPEFLKIGVDTVGLFGSYARNEQSAQSDIDLLIDFKPDKATFDNLMAFHDIVEIIFKDIKVEVVTKNSLSQYIGPKILKEVIYA